MTDLSFVDTNILVYARDPRDERKRRLADERIKQLWSERSGRISTQVLNEFYVTITRKLSPPLPADKAWNSLLTLMTWGPQAIDQDLMLAAREIERRYCTSWWDATIVAAAQAQRCTVLLSEDFQDGMMFDQLKVENPFTSRAQEARIDYRTALAPLPRHRARGRPAKAAQHND